MEAWLVFLGPAQAAPFDAGRSWLSPLGLAAGQSLFLTLRHRQRWGRIDVTRVIVGSDPGWADLVLQDKPLTIQPEHARFYLRPAAPERSEFRAMKNCPVVINHHPHPPLDWVNLRAGDRLQLSCWLFEYHYRA
jgi:hypothetical protein